MIGFLGDVGNSVVGNVVVVDVFVCVPIFFLYVSLWAFAPSVAWGKGETPSTIISGTLQDPMIGRPALTARTKGGGVAGIGGGSRGWWTRMGRRSATSKNCGVRNGVVASSWRVIRNGRTWEPRRTGTKLERSEDRVHGTTKVGCIELVESLGYFGFFLLDVSSQAIDVDFKRVDPIDAVYLVLMGGETAELYYVAVILDPASVVGASENVVGLHGGRKLVDGEVRSGIFAADRSGDRSRSRAAGDSRSSGSPG